MTTLRESCHIRKPTSQISPAWIANVFISAIVHWWTRVDHIFSVLESVTPLKKNGTTLLGLSEYREIAFRKLRNKFTNLTFYWNVQLELSCWKSARRFTCDFLLRQKQILWYKSTQNEFRSKIINYFWLRLFWYILL